MENKCPSRIGGFLLVALLLFSMMSILVPQRSIAMNKPSGRTHKTVQRSPDNSLIYKSDDGSYYNAEIKNSEIMSTMHFSNYSKILMDNVTIYSSGAPIKLFEHAKLIINNAVFKFYSTTKITIYLYDESEVVISNSTADTSVRIYLYAWDQSKITLRNTDMYTYVYCHDYSSIEIHDTCNRITLYLYDDSTGTLNSSYISFTPNIYCYGSSQLSIYYSNYTNIIHCHDYSYLYVGYSYVYSIEQYENSTAYLEYTNCSSIEARGDSFLNIYQCNISGTLKMMWTNDIIAMSGPGACGLIYYSYINKLYLYSGRVTRIISSYVNYLMYFPIYNGTVEINASGIHADSSYPNYENIGSTIVSEGSSTYYLFAVGATEVKVVGTTYPAYYYLYDVDNVLIENLKSGVFQSYAWYSNLNVSNSNISWSSNYYYGSSITYMNFSTYSYLHVSTEFASVMFQNLTAAITYGSLYFGDSHVNFSNVYLTNFALTISRSVFVFDRFEAYTSGTCKFNAGFSSINGTNSIIQQEFEAYSSTIYLYNVTVDIMDIQEFELRDGYFEMGNGMIVSGNGTLVYGVVNLGLSTINMYIFDYIYLYNASLNVSGIITYSDIYDHTLRLELYDNSVAYLYRINASDTNFYLYITDSNAYVYGGEIYQIHLTHGNATLKSACVTSSITISGTSLDIWNCSIDDIIINDDSYIYLELTDAYGVYNSLPIGEEETLGEIDLPSIYLGCNQSTISVINLISYGIIDILDSTIGDFVYAFQWVVLDYSTVTGICFNTTVFTEGNVEVVNNRIITGYYENRFTGYGSTVSNPVDVLVVSDVPHEDRISLHVENSSYYGIISMGGHVEIENTNLSIILLYESGYIDISSTTINTSILLANVIYGDYLYISDTKLFHVPTYISGMYSLLIDNLLLDTPSLYLVDTDGSISQLRETYSLATVHIYNSDIDFEDSHLGVVQVFSSMVNVTRTNISDLTLEDSDVVVSESGIVIGHVWLYNNSDLEITNATIDNINVVTNDAGYYYKSITATIANSSISTSYLRYYYVTNHLGASFCNESILGEYGEKLSYVNTNLSSATHRVIFEIDKYGRATIENYTGPYKIHALYINSMLDTKPPTILPINGTNIEYELGLETNVCVKLFDATPTEYYVYLDGDPIDNRDYYNNMTLSITLSTYINTEGTHLLEIYAYDIMDNEAHITIEIITYPQQPPVFISTPDSEYDISEGESIYLSWIAEDLSPDTYMVTVNDRTVKQGVWQSGMEITYRFTGNETGEYNIVITVRDKLGLETSNTVVINVSSKASGKVTGQISNYMPLIIIPLVLIAVIIAIKSRKKKKQ